MCNYYPLAASLTLFANVLQNPTAPSAVPDIALMHCVTSILTTNFSAASNPRSSVHLQIFKQILSVAAEFVAKARGEDPEKYKDLGALKLPDNYLQLQSARGWTSDKGWGGAESTCRRGGGRVMKIEDRSTSTSASHSGNEHDEDQTTPSSGGGSQDLNGLKKKSVMKFMPPADTPSPAPPPYIPAGGDVPQSPGGFSAVSQTPGKTPAQSRMAGTVISEAINMGRHMQGHNYSRHGTESPPVHNMHIPAPPGLLNACGGGTGCYQHSGSGTRTGPQFCDGNHLNGVPVQQCTPHTPDISRNQSIQDLRLDQQAPTAILGSNVPPYINPMSPSNPQQQSVENPFDFNQFNWQPGTGGVPGNTGFAAEGEINFNDFTGQGIGGQNGEEGDFLPMVFQWDLADIWGGQNGGMGSGGMGF